MNLFQKTIRRQNEGRPPVWFMRQAGRYHSHYQALRQKYSFIELCKLPEVAAEVAMGPIQDFGFDAAILFSDILFPLEVMGMGLKYDEGPKLDWHLESVGDLSRLKSGADLASQLSFQGEAVKLTRARLPKEKGLLGFVGGPLTLYFYAVEGSHQGALQKGIKGITDGRYEGFSEKILDLLAENMAIQARAGTDTVAVLDTCGGELDPLTYGEFAIPVLKRLFQKFHERCPNVPIAYYSKKTGPKHWEKLEGLPISYMGVDWNPNIVEVLRDFGEKYAIQGNVDPHWLFLDSAELETKLRKVFDGVLALPQIKRRGWVCGLGHGVLPKTPENNVRLFLKIQKEMFS